MVSDTVIASFPNPVIPFDPYAVSNLASVPVTDVMVAVLTVPVVCHLRYSMLSHLPDYFLL